MTVFVGTSGWQYRHWRRTFYPRGLAQDGWLDYFTERFRCVEVNNTFYRLPERKTFERWAERIPEDFVMALKFSRYATHMKRLQDARDSIDLFFERADALGCHLGPVLIQLPANFRPAPGRLDEALGGMPAGVRVAVEFRHNDWFTDETYEVLRSHNAALCLADRGSRPVTAIERTADWGYVRFHAGTAAPEPCYGRTALDTWAGRVAELWPDGADVFAFFNNDPRACALRDARTFALALRRHGRTPTRIPDAGDVHVE